MLSLPTNDKQQRIQVLYWKLVVRYFGKHKEEMQRHDCIVCFDKRMNNICIENKICYSYIPTCGPTESILAKKSHNSIENKSYVLNMNNVYLFLLIIVKIPCLKQCNYCLTLWPLTSHKHQLCEQILSAKFVEKHCFLNYKF